MSPAREDWMISAVRKFLLDYFPGREIAHFSRGRVAEMFSVSEQGQLLHQVYITRKFLERAPDPQTLSDALTTAEIVARMRTAGTLTVELH